MADSPTFYAHTTVENGATRYRVGEAVPSDMPGIDELVEHGAVASTPPVVTQSPAIQVRRFDGDWDHAQIASGEAAVAEIHDGGSADA